MKYRQIILFIRNFLQGLFRQRKENLNLISTQMDWQEDESARQHMAFRVMSTSSSLVRLKKVGIDITSIIDIGASDGSWTKMALEVFPESKSLLIEANAYHLPELEKFASTHKKSNYMLVAAANYDGHGYFDDHLPYGGLASEDSNEQFTTKVEFRKLDSIVGPSFGPKLLLKLDTHGFELEILEGSKEVLERVHILVIEAYIFRLHPKALNISEIIEYLTKRGFKLIDITEPLWRERDSMLWQCDLVLIRGDEPIFEKNSYK